VFPKIWKEAIVCPIPKVKQSSCPSDYRPVSLLPLFSKVVESAINHLFILHINPFLSDNQFGFRHGRSTVDALTLFQHNILTGFRSCEQAKRPASVVATFFDLSKAFDTVPHNKLLELIKTYPIPSWWFPFLTSYLSDRSFKVKVCKSLSCFSPVGSGVPQGSVLGPSLFIAFFNVITTISLCTKSKIIIYADDLVMTHPLDSENSFPLVQLDIDKLSLCVDNLGLEFNADKCKFMTIRLAN
jgi:hypothetical protein